MRPGRSVGNTINGAVVGVTDDDVNNHPSMKLDQ